MGGSRGAAYANTLQTIVFMIMGTVAFVFIIKGLGGLEQAGKVPARITETGAIVQDFRYDKEAGELKANDPPKTIGRVVRAESSDLADRQPHLNRVPVTANSRRRIPRPANLFLSSVSWESPSGPSLPTFSYP